MKELGKLHRMAHKAFLDAYNCSSFKQLLYFRLDKEIDEIVPRNANFSDQVFEVLKAAHREGWFHQLIRAGRSETPRHPQFDLLVNMINGSGDAASHKQWMPQIDNERLQMLRMVAEAIVVCIIILLAIAIFAIFAMLASILLLVLA